MKKRLFHLLALSLGVLFINTMRAQNPLVMDQFTADPTARVFEGKIYVYPSHDIPASPGKGRANWFVMEDYHVFSSENLVDWKDHGVIVSQDKVDWVNASGYAMWAPDCVYKNGKYYFYFPAPAKPGASDGPGGASQIGVAIADKPYGPFKPESKPIAGPVGIDPCVLIDKEGSAYLYYSLGGIFIAKLKDNMVELDSKPQKIANLPEKGLIEGPFAFERNGIYYLTFPHVANKIERLEYAMGKSPTGPFTVTGVIMDESESGCWTNHHSLVEYKGQWYLFYHDKDLSPEFDKNRSIKADYLSFNQDGTINKVIATLRGVGIVNAKSAIQIDRYSAASQEGTSVSFINNANRREGWKIALSEPKAWVRFDKVDFGKGRLKSTSVRAASSTGGWIEIRVDKADGPVLAKVKIEKGAEWTLANAKLANVLSGIHDLIITLGEKSNVELDWVRFE
jgi:beta-xylosidase